jgi:SAM-dependent methyltransferase
VSRRGISVDEDERWVFNRLAADYAARPGYPAGLVARLVTLAGGPGARAADLGAGTGLLAAPLAGAGLRVDAVEPARAMLAALGAPPPAGVTAIHAAAEATGLPEGTFDLVVLADALHWTDAARAGREAARLLQGGAVVAVVEPRFAATPFMSALSALLAAANPKARATPPPLQLFFSHAGAGAHLTERFEQVERLEPPRLEAVLRSLSLVGPALGPSRLAALQEAAGALAASHGGADWSREVLLHWGRGRPGRGGR